MPKAKSRIDKKTAVTFKLVHRSQRDPLIADETAPQHVLVECVGKQRQRRPAKSHAEEEEDGDIVGPDGTTTKGGEGASSSKKIRGEELKKYGVYYDDDYDYMQHLKSVSDFVEEEQIWQPVESKSKTKSSSKSEGKHKLMLPSSVFASVVEEDEGMLSKAALPIGPQPDWDHEVVAAMDEDFDFENPDNLLDDDFVTQALLTVGAATGTGAAAANSLNINEKKEKIAFSDNKNKKTDAFAAPGEGYSNGDSDDDSEDDGGCVSSSDGRFSQASGDKSESEEESKDRLFTNLETKSHFTNYSLTSSVIRRSKGLTTLDERFETLYEKEYGDDTEIGALDAEEIEGYVQTNNESILAKLLEDFEKGRENRTEAYEAEALKSKVLNSLRLDALGEEELVNIEIDESGKHNEDRFDCESIISTYSNLYNHPKLIYEPKTKRSSAKIEINPSTGIPRGVLSKPGLTARSLKELESLNSANRTNGGPSDARSVMSAASKLSQLSIRPKDESPQEKKARKCGLKALRKERRIERKANQVAFKQEHQRQEQEVLNIRQNLACVRLV